MKKWKVNTDDSTIVTEGPDSMKGVPWKGGHAVRERVKEEEMR